MPSYLVSWEIDIEAEDREAAAREAHRIQKANGTANVFLVTDDKGEQTTVDLEEIDQHRAAITPTRAELNHLGDLTKEHPFRPVGAYRG